MRPDATDRGEDQGARPASNRGSLILLLLTAVVTTWFSPFGRDLFVGDETRYGRVVHEMAESGNYLVPTLEGEPYAHKPPVHFWMILAAIRLVGERVIAFVLPSLIALLAILLLIVVRGTKHSGVPGGLVAAGVYASFWLSWGSAQSARMDQTYTLLIALAALFLHDHFASSARYRLAAAGLISGLAVLVKGPMVIVIMIVLFAIESFRYRKRPGLESLAAVGLMALVILAWLVPAVLTGGSAYGEEMVVDQSVGRAFSSWVHAAPPWFYLVRAPLTFFPWALIVAVALWHAFRQRKEDDWAGFLLSWFGAVFVPYSLISGKLDVYMLPAMVSAALLVGWLFPRIGPKMIWKLNALLISGFIGLAALAANIAFPFLDGSDPDVAPWLIGEVRVILWLSTVAAFGAFVLALGRERTRDQLVATTGLIALVPVTLVLTVAIETVNRESSTVRLIEALGRTGVPGDRIAMHWTPHLWGEGMDEGLHEVFHGYPSEMDEMPAIVVVRTDHAEDLGDELAGYTRLETVRMISKEFDVYGRSHNGE